jgi:hypothetical protein
MSELLNKSHAKFFGEGFLREMCELMPDLLEMAPPSMMMTDPPEGKEPHIINTHLGKFLMHISSPMVHPNHMPGHTKRLYEAAPEMPPAAPKKKKVAAPGPELAAPVKKEKKEKKGADPAKRNAEQQHLEQIRNDANQRMQERIAKGKQLEAQGNHYEAHGLMNPFEHMRRGFHAAFGVDPKTGQQVNKEEEHERLKKLKASKKLFSDFVQKHGKLSPATAKNYSMFGENHKTQTSQGVGYKTIGLSLTPGTHSGYRYKDHDYDMCPNASSECRKNCLGLTAGGNRQYPYVTMKGKLLRTHFLHEHPEAAARIMHQEILDNERDAGKTQVQKPITDANGEPVMQPMLNSKGKPVLNRSTGKPMEEPKTEPVFNADGTPATYRSGIRMNVTSDIPYEHLMPKQFFESHIGEDPNNPNTTFYDYTKMHGRFNHKDMPKNYHLALSHTGSGHPESNDKHVVNLLRKGGVVASVYKRGKDQPEAKFYQDDETGERWPVANGDNDDNVFDRHASIGADKSRGVVSGLKLKGVSNDAAGNFANEVDKNGIVHLNQKKKPDLVQIGGMK